MKRIVYSTIMMFLTLMLVLSPMTSAQGTDSPKVLDKSEQKKALAHINKQISQKAQNPVKLNEVIKETYSYEHEDGSVTTVSTQSITVLAEDQDKVKRKSDGSFEFIGSPSNSIQSDASVMGNPVHVITYKDASTGGTQAGIIFYSQTVHGKFSYYKDSETGWGILGSMDGAIHSSPPSVSCAPFCTAGDPDPFNYIVEPSRSAAHVGSNVQLEFVDGQAGTRTLVTRLIFDVNGNYSILDS